MIHQLVEQGVLSAEDEGDQRFGVEVELQERVDLGKDLDAHQVGFIDDQDGALLFGSDFREKATEGVSEERDGERTGLHLEGEEDLLEEFEDGSGVGRDRDETVEGGVQGMGGIAQGGGFAGADLSGDDRHGAQFEGIVESVCEGLETWQGIEVLDLDILREGFSLEAEKVLIESHRRVSFRRVFHPDRV